MATEDPRKVSSNFGINDSDISTAPPRRFFETTGYGHPPFPSSLARPNAVHLPPPIFRLPFQNEEDKQAENGRRNM
jgi:hypothetical protein